MTEIFFTIKQIQRVSTTLLHWRTLMMLHWPLVDTIQIQIKLKYWIYQATHGQKLPTILIMISKFSVFLKWNSYFRDLTS